MKIKGFIALFAAAAMLSTLGGCAEKKNDSKTQPESSASSQPESALINAEHIYQLDKWPTGCESVSAVMAMKAAGLDITVDEFIDNYLNCSPRPFDPEKSFGGDPRSKSGKGCYAPVIKAALDKALAGTDFKATELKNVPIAELCKKYIAAGTPVIFGERLKWLSPLRAIHGNLRVKR